MNYFKRIIKQEYDTIAVLLFMLALFSFIMFQIKYDTDLLPHAMIARHKLNQGRLFSGNFLLYFIVNLFSGFTGNTKLLMIAMVFVISAAETAKYVMTKTMFNDFLGERCSKILSVSMLFVFVVPITYLLRFFGLSDYPNNMYMQYLVPNVWHNSTVIFCMPFAIYSYWLSVKQLEQYDDKRNIIISITVLLSVLVKPSFFFVYVVAYPVLMLFKYKFSKTFIKSLLPVFSGLLAMGYEYLSIYQDASDGSSVCITLSNLLSCDFWKGRLLYVLSSLFVPIVFTVCYWKNVKGNVEFWFIVLMLVAAIGIWLVCKELGPRESDGNFYWQIIPAMWLMFYFILRNLVVDYQMRGSKNCYFNKTTVMLALYSFNVIMGVIYLIRLLITKNYF